LELQTQTEQNVNLTKNR